MSEDTPLFHISDVHTHTCTLALALIACNSILAVVRMPTVHTLMWFTHTHTDTPIVLYVCIFYPCSWDRSVHVDIHLEWCNLSTVENPENSASSTKSAWCIIGLNGLWFADVRKTSNVLSFTFMHLADAFIQSDLQCTQAIHFCQYVFPGNRTNNLCAANAML